MSVIRAINEISTSGEEGYEIVCDDQVIHVKIDAYQGCCEVWGYIASEDDFSKFIGEHVVGVRLVDTALKTYDWDGWDEERETMFVNVDTTAGMIQFAVYNCHNGYYGHTARVSSRDLNHEEVL